MHRQQSQYQHVDFLRAFESKNWNPSREKKAALKKNTEGKLIFEVAQMGYAVKSQLGRQLKVNDDRFVKFRLMNLA